MSKRILSLLLAIVMVVLAVPVLALPAFAAGSADVLYSTNFSKGSANFPTFDPVADGSNAGSNLQFHGNWEVGASKVNDLNLENNTYTVDATDFVAYQEIDASAGNTQWVINTGDGWWGSDKAWSGGYFIEGGSYENMLTAGIKYGTGNKVDGAEDKNTRPVANYASTSTIRYTVEFAGIINISAALNFTYDNGIDLGIYHNGTLVYTIVNDGTNCKGESASGGQNPHDYGTVVKDLSVKAGDTISFVSLGDVSFAYDAASGTPFNYGQSNRGARALDFTVDYTAMGMTSEFGPNSGNWPVADGNSASIPNVAWDAGNIPASAVQSGTDFGVVSVGDYNTFTPFTQYSAGDSSFHNGAIWSPSSVGSGKGGGIFLTTNYPNLLVMQGIYSGGDANARTILGIDAVSEIRYTAEFNGAAIIRADVKYFASNGTKLVIRLNGETIYTSATVGVGGETEVATVSKDLNAGDVIEFIALPDLNYDGDSSVAAGYGSFDYNKGKRGFYINSLSVAYEPGYTVPELVVEDSWGNFANGRPTSDKWYFFNWTQNGASAPLNSVQVDAATDFVGAVKDAYIANAETTTLKEAFDAFAVAIKSQAKMPVPAGNWAMTDMKDQELLYMLGKSEGNLYNLRVASAGTVAEATISYFFVAEDYFDKNMAELWTDFVKAELGIAQDDAITPEQEASIANQLAATYTATIDRNKLTNYKSTAWSGAAAQAGLAWGEYNKNWNAVRPSAATEAGAVAYTWTAPKNAVVKSLTIDTLQHLNPEGSDAAGRENGLAWALYHNDTALIPFGDSVNASSKSVMQEAINAYLAENPISMKMGDTLKIAFRRGGNGNEAADKGGMSMTMTLSYTPYLSSSVQLIIDDVYNVVVNVVPSHETVVEAGIFVNGEYIPGEKQEDGSYEVVYGTFNVTDLAGTKDASGNGSDWATTVTYSPYETLTSKSLGTSVTTDTVAMLNAYIAMGGKVGMLAQAINALAVVTNAQINAGEGFTIAAQDTVKSYLKQGNPTVSGDNSSTPLDILFESMKANSSDYTSKYDTSAPTVTLKDFGAVSTAGVTSGYGDVDATDATQFGYKIVSAGVNLGSKVSLVFLANANGDGDMYALKQHNILVNGTVYTANFKEIKVGDAYYMATIVDLPLSMYNADLSVNIVDADNAVVSATLSYSMKAFCVNTWDMKASTSTFYSIKALFALGLAVDNYLN